MSEQDELLEALSDMVIAAQGNCSSMYATKALMKARALLHKYAYASTAPLATEAEAKSSRPKYGGKYGNLRDRVTPGNEAEAVEEWCVRTKYEHNWSSDCGLHGGYPMRDADTCSNCGKPIRSPTAQRVEK